MPSVVVDHSPTPSIVSTAAFSNGDGKKALAAWLKRKRQTVHFEHCDLTDVAAIGRAVKAVRQALGPITLLDEVGLDIAGKSGAIFTEAFGDRLSPSHTLRRVVESGRLGRKGRRGFYVYDADGKRGGVDASVYALTPSGNQRVSVVSQEVQERCVLSLANEAVRCLEEGIVRSARDGDIGAVFGIGFSPFRGGPFRYLDAIGASRAVDRLEELNSRFGGRFVPADLLLHMARKGERFRPDGERGR